MNFKQRSLSSKDRKNKMKKTGSIAVFLLATLSVLSANTDNRLWRLKDDKSVYAELVNYDEGTGDVHLRINEEEDIVYPFDQFQVIDKAWLVEWLEFSEDLNIKVEELGGSLSSYQSQGKYPTDFYVYEPSNGLAGDERSLLILFHPGGKGARLLKRFLESSEETKTVIVACDTFRNTGSNVEKEKALYDRFVELLPFIEATVVHNSTKLYMGGASGGAWRAFHYAAWIERPWAGILSMGGWLGGEDYYDLEYPKMKVAFVNGNQDHAANQYVEPDTEVLEKRDCEIAVIAFEGGHQVAPVSAQIKALYWLTNQEEYFQEQ